MSRITAAPYAVRASGIKGGNTYGGCLNMKAEQAGFTLIELVLSLIILGLVGAIGAMGFTDAVRGYMYGVDNANIAGKAQAALERINLELTHINFWDETTATEKNGVTVSSTSSITFDVDFGGNRTSENGVVLTYNQQEGTLTLRTDTSSDAKILVDDVTNFSLAYYDDPTDDTPATSYTSGQTLCIGVTLELTGVNGEPMTFSIRVVPMFNLPYAAPS